MEHATDIFQIEPINQPFLVNGKEKTSSSVTVTILRDGNEISRKRYGFVDLSTLYEKIKNGAAINLDQCYVKGFSLEAYREKNQMPTKTLVDLPEFSAQHSFFDCEEDIDFSYSRIKDGKVSFRNTTFYRGNISFANTEFGKGDLDFSHTNFHTDFIDFRFAIFSDGDVHFEGMSCKAKTISFVNTKFGNGKINFREAAFDCDRVNFQYSQFDEGDISFEKASIDANLLDFRRVEFGAGRVDFRRVNFCDTAVNFEESEFGKGRVNFRSSRFGNTHVSFEMVNFGTGEVLFEGVEFGKGNVSFAKARFDQLILRNSILNCRLDLRIAKGRTIDLSDSLLRDILDLKPGTGQVHLEELHLIGMRNLGRLIIDWKANNLFELIANQSQSTDREKADQFNLLKTSFNSSGQYSDEDKAYVAFKRYELKANLQEATGENSLNALWAYPMSGFKYLVFDKMGLYATNPIRVFTSMLVVYSIFSIVFFTLPEFTDAAIHCSGADNDQVSELKIAFYYSAITFLTIGYGDCLPAGHIKWLAPLEGWMGVFLMSYFTVAFVRKILR